ncbi:hypothetical protein SAMN04487968_106218 [Nocardioides terrae]|uniref:Uncharacterized protein n=1 Tax=Nocardioides terrae TaxID=574651 RepID=A0A1I1J877_9ACTN|nr:hypothetical protein [Nocardioides terrae]SFC44585.1 hypothetical protein SAMN04487968_106218 [Nocardioides terrae]
MAEPEEPVVAALAAVIRDHGWPAAAQPSRLKAMLSDALGAQAAEHRAAMEALVVAAEEGVVEAIAAAGTALDEEAVDGLRQRLEEWGLAPERAGWAVRTLLSLAPEPTEKVPVTSPAPAVEATLPPPGGSLGTVLPPIATMPTVETVLPAGPASAADETVLPPVAIPVGPTELPTVDEVTHIERAETVARRRRATRWVVPGVVAALVAGGGIAALVRSGDDDPSGSAHKPASSPASVAPRASGTELTAATAQDIPAPARALAMGWEKTGVRITALGPVKQVGAGSDAKAAPAGGSLLGFTLADWPCANTPHCRPWTKARLHVEVDGSARPLPAGSSSYVVAVPAGAESVDLVGAADGITQRLSLLEEAPAAGNIAVLARPQRRFKIGKTFSVTEHTDRPLDFGDGRRVTSVQRKVTVHGVELGYFIGSRRPSSPTRAFLYLDVTFTYPADQHPQGVDRRLAKLLDDAGKPYPAVDAGPTTLVFEVPADISSATLALGGSHPRTACRTDNQDICDEPYTVTLDRRQVRLPLS